MKKEREVGEHHPNWRGGRIVTSQGYVKIRTYDRPQRYTLEHVLIIETAIGKPLRKTAVAHHINGNKSDNTRTNLIACDSQAYHLLLHAREDALEATGHADWRMCCRCKQHDAPTNLRGFKVHGEPSKQFYHAKCQNAYARLHPSWQVKQKKAG